MDCLPPRRVVLNRRIIKHMTEGIEPTPERSTAVATSVYVPRLEGTSSEKNGCLACQEDVPWGNRYSAGGGKAFFFLDVLGGRRTAGWKKEQRNKRSGTRIEEPDGRGKRRGRCVCWWRENWGLVLFSLAGIAGILVGLVVMGWLVSWVGG